MAKKHTATQELVNIYPGWSQVRSNEQSIGYQFLNSFGSPFDYIDKQLITHRHNQFITIANLDEVDILYKVELPVDFEFDTDLRDPTDVCNLPPTVSGLWIDETFSGYVSVEISEENNIQDFWYLSLPTRITLDTVYSGLSEFLFSGEASVFPHSGLLEHHLEGGRLWVETTGGTQYIQQNELGGLDRGQVTITGVTRKGLEETEVLIFPWDMKQPSLKEWDRITKVDVFGIEPEVLVDIRSADFQHPPYLSFWNNRFSDTRTKVDEFYALGNDGATLDRVGYIADDWQQLVLGFSEKDVKQSWELLDEDGNPVDFTDIALQPFTDNIWAVTQSGILCIYDNYEHIASGVNLLQSKTPGADIEIEVEKKHVVLGEDITFTPWHARPLKEILKYRVWYQDPSGAKYGLLDGSPVSFTSDFYVIAETIKRNISNVISIPADMRGEYLIVLEVIYIDNTTQNDRVIVSVDYKLPLAQFDISSIVPEDIVGIDFDADQRLWVKTTTDNFYRLNIHKDVMLVDYDNKIIYFHEPYDGVKIIDD